MFGAFSSTTGDGLFFDSNEKVFFTLNGIGNIFVTSQVFRDASAWYHFVLVFDSTSATTTINGGSTDRARFYVNGSQVSAFSSTAVPSQNADCPFINTTNTHEIGRNIGSTQYFDGYLTEINFIDGQALTPSSFGETDTITGVWKPKKYAGTYGTNGFYLNFSDNSGTTSTTLGKDSSGNSKNWTPNNFSVTGTYQNDSLIDVPTNYADGDRGRGNYATLNPLTLQSPAIPSDAGTLSEGNLTITTHAGTGAGAHGTMAVNLPTGNKWYCEVTPRSGVTAATNAAQIMIANGASEGFPSTQSVSYYSSESPTYTDGDVIGIAYDGPANQVSFYKNGVLAKGPSAVSTSFGAVYPAARDNITSSIVFDFNFGQRPWAYTPPAGFLAMNTQNMLEPTIKKPSSCMDVATYTGTGSALTPTSSLGFSPDLVWIKSRSAATDHAIYDTVRGVQKRLESNNTDAEVASDGGVTAFNTAGFTLGTLAQVNTSAATYAAWCWDESATPGFDIVTYTGNGTAGRQVGHGLGVAPRFVICKTLSETSPSVGWQVYHASRGNTRALWLNSTAAEGTNISYWNNQSPTATLVRLGDNLDVNKNGTSYVMYAWAEVNGFSRFFTYTGNGYSDGPFVFCGFRPRWVMVKNTSGNNWAIFDAQRNTYNGMDERLHPNLSQGANTGAGVVIDFLSNGFKCRNSDGLENQSGQTIIFAAFAEAPFKYALAR
jgi:hypothetical protein